MCVCVLCVQLNSSSLSVVFSEEFSVMYGVWACSMWYVYSVIYVCVNEWNEMIIEKYLSCEAQTTKIHFTMPWKTVRAHLLNLRKWNNPFEGIPTGQYSDKVEIKSFKFHMHSWADWIHLKRLIFSKLTLFCIVVAAVANFWIGSKSFSYQNWHTNSCNGFYNFHLAHNNNNSCYTTERFE